MYILYMKAMLCYYCILANVLNKNLYQGILSFVGKKKAAVIHSAANNTAASLLLRA